MRQNNKGFSLVELIVALAIFGIAGVAVFGFMVNSSRLYQRTNVEVKLQYEQQLAVNQIRDMVVESDRGIYFDEASKTLALYGAAKQEGAATVYPVTVVRYVESEQKMYYGIKNFAALADVSFAAVDTTKLLAENVKAFKVDLTKVKNDKVLFDVTFIVGDKEQTAKETVALRNRLVVSNEVDTIWGDMPEVVDSFIRKITISRDGREFANGEQDVIGKADSDVIVVYTANVIANEDSERDYKVAWSVDKTVTGVSLSADGKITVVADASETTFTLTATSVDDPSKSAYIEVQITDTGKYPVSVTLTQGEVTDGNGFRTYKLIPTVYYSDGSHLSDYGLFTWEFPDKIPGGGTFKEEMGELTVGPGANGSNIIISAKTKERKADGTPAVGTCTISINGIKEYVPGPTAKVNCSTSLSRGGYVFPTIMLENATHSNYTYNWKVEPYYDDETSQFENGNNTADFSLISLSPQENGTGNNSGTGQHTLTTLANRRSIVLNCAQKLNWNNTFKVKVSATAIDKNGNEVVATPKIVTISPVEIKISRADLAVYHKPIPAEGKAGYTGYPCLTNTEICYEDWNFDGRQKGDINAKQYDTRRWFYVEYTNIFMKQDWLSDTELKFNFEYKNSGGAPLLNSNVGNPQAETYNGSMRFCGFSKQKLYDWETNPNRPVDLCFWVTLKDHNGNEVESNKDDFKLVYEWRTLDELKQN